MHDTIYHAADAAGAVAEYERHGCESYDTACHCWFVWTCPRCGKPVEVRGEWIKAGVVPHWHLKCKGEG